MWSVFHCVHESPAFTCDRFFFFPDTNSSFPDPNALQERSFSGSYFLSPFSISPSHILHIPALMDFIQLFQVVMPGSPTFSIRVARDSVSS